MPHRLDEHLRVKRRHIGDLVQFIKTRTDGVSNYALLLGAGASVTSGINSAEALVLEWRRDLYETLCPSPQKPYSAEAAKDYLSHEHAAWYSPQREYGCLFEKKFDLPRQRRMFVENQVSDKQPSLGYAYLIRLIEENYFNTVFTTNFDDLMNESFHQFSDRRPIVCAHDSSITSVTVTSKRPKIIKLHGDYLFDDIKSTVKETESLEENTKRKFIEFSKEHGLVVVGYSGHDRSVMDVLHHLLKQEDYFKHGIYWCLRKSDIASDEVTKLLWKDRVYWVEIDGYDELMAKLYSVCVGSQLPINTGIVSQKPRETLSRFCDDVYLQHSASTIIQTDLGKFRSALEREALVTSLRTVIDRQQEASADLKDRDLVRLLDARRLVEDKEYEHGLQRIESELAQQCSIELRTELLILRLRIENETMAFDSAVKTCEKLISHDEKNAFYWLKRSENELAFERKLFAIDKAIEIDPYYPFAHSKRAKLFLAKLTSDPRADAESISKAIAEDFRTAIRQDPSSDNDAWGGLILFLSDRNVSGGNHDDEISQHLSRLREMDAYSVNYLAPLVDFASCVSQKSTGLRDRVLEEISKAIEAQPRKRKRKLELLRLQALRNFGKKSELLAALAGYDAEPKFSEDRAYVEFRAKVYAEVEGKIHDAIRLLESKPANRKVEALLLLLIRYMCMIKHTEQAQNILSESEHALPPMTASRFQQVIDESSGNYDRVLMGIRQRKERSVFPEQDVTLETHSLLKLGRYPEAERLARSVLQQANFSLKFDALIINFELSRLMQNEKVDKGRLGKLTEHGEGLVCACAYLLLDNKSKAAEIFLKAAEEDKTEPYEIRRWAIFDRPANKNWLDEIFRGHGLFSEIGTTKNSSDVGVNAA